MGFRKSWDPEDIEMQIRRCAAEACSPYNDGWTAMSAKEDLVRLKWILEDVLEICPTFVGEEKWEQERLVELLKRK